jgi:hypothetical protein
MRTDRAKHKSLSGFFSGGIPIRNKLDVFDARSPHYVNRMRHVCVWDVFGTFHKGQLTGTFLENVREARA